MSVIIIVKYVFYQFTGHTQQAVLYAFLLGSKFRLSEEPRTGH
jgi:hypothetical protein